MFRIRYGDDISSNDVITDIKSLKPLESIEPPKFKVTKPSAPVEVLEPLSKKLKDKSKKKSKWSDVFSKYSPSYVPTESDRLENYADMLEKHNSDEYTDDDIVDEQRRGYDRLKKEDNLYKKEFAEELTLLYNLLHESNTFGKKLDKKFESMEGSKIRGTTKYSTDLAMSIISVKSNKLAIIKELATIKKHIADLKFKESKDKSEDGYNMDRLASSYLKGIMSQGRNDFIKNLGQGGTDDFDDRQRDHGTSAALNDYEKENIDSVIYNRLVSEGNPFRSEEGSLNIQMEKLGIKTMIKRNIDTGDWMFYNINQQGQRVDGFPLPSTDRKIKWNSENGTATDDYNGIYVVNEVCNNFY